MFDYATFFGGEIMKQRLQGEALQKEIIKSLKEIKNTELLMLILGYVNNLKKRSNRK